MEGCKKKEEVRWEEKKMGSFIRGSFLYERVFYTGGVLYGGSFLYGGVFFREVFYGGAFHTGEFFIRGSFFVEFFYGGAFYTDEFFHGSFLRGSIGARCVKWRR